MGLIMNVTSSENLILKNKNLDKHPNLEVVLFTYLEALGNGYEPDEETLDAVLSVLEALDVSDPVVSDLLDTLIDELTPYDDVVDWLTPGRDVFYGLPGDTYIDGVSGQDALFGDYYNVVGLAGNQNALGSNQDFSGFGDDYITSADPIYPNAYFNGDTYNLTSFSGFAVVTGNDHIVAPAAGSTSIGDSNLAILQDGGSITFGDDLIELQETSGTSRLLAMGDVGRLLVDGVGEAFGGDDTIDASLSEVQINLYGEGYRLEWGEDGGGAVIVCGDDLLIAGSYGGSLVGDFGFGGAEEYFGGNDTLVSGIGNDDLVGDDAEKVTGVIGGADLFVFLEDSGQDRITDFQSGIDKVDLTALGITFSDLTFTQVGADILVDLDAANPGENTISFYQIPTLLESDFIFV
jgi:hypothetical protein